jgi:hypothetical protein
VQSSTAADALAASGGDIVWSDTQLRTLLGRETSPSDLSFDGAYDVALRGGFVYWATQHENGWVSRAKIEGGPVLKIAPSPHRVEAITTDERFVYWAERGSMRGGLLLASSGRLLRAAR